MNPLLQELESAIKSNQIKIVKKYITNVKLDVEEVHLEFSFNGGDVITTAHINIANQEVEAFQYEIGTPETGYFFNGLNAQIEEVIKNMLVSVAQTKTIQQQNRKNQFRVLTEKAFSFLF
jgi:hypothetical protein